jgi:hypothetical protein
MCLTSRHQKDLLLRPLKKLALSHQQPFPAMPFPSLHRSRRRKMAHYFCKFIQDLKKERPAASREDILWNVRDRWGFPIVLWRGHALKASLCKLDHGLAMLLGLKHTNGDPFDPLVHIDLECCTVVIDTWATKKGMSSYPMIEWDPL